MGIAERREREKLATRKKILDAARELFLAHGYDAVTMRKIAEKIEYSPTAIYVHFEDKDSLIRELCDTDFGWFAAKMARIAKVQDPFERLLKVGRAYVEFGLEYPNHYRLMFMTPAHPAVDPEHSRLRKGNPDEDPYALLLLTVKECMEKELLREDLTDPELVAQVLWMAGHGVVSLHVAMGKDPWIDWRAPRKAHDLMVESLIRGMARVIP